MNVLYLVNYFIGGSFIALLSLEVGFALTLLFSYKKHRDIFPIGFKYLWGIVGTFLVFYLINFEATYPGILAGFAKIYDVPFIIIAVLMLFKNSFITYAYHVKDEKKEEIFLKIYAAATVILTFFAGSILTSMFTGRAINPITDSINLISVFTSPLNMALFAAIILISLLSYYGKMLGRILGPSLLAIGVFIIGIIKYPYIFGDKVNLIDNITQSQAIITSTIIVAILGYILLIGAFLLLVRIHKIHYPRKAEKTKEKY